MSGGRGRSRRGAPSDFQADVHRLQLDLFNANQRLINEAVEGYTDEFRRYEARYRRTVRSVRGPVRFDRLVAAAKRARVVLVGDYHTLAQSQRAFFRILRRQPAGADLLVALEMLPAAQQPEIDRFVAGRLSESTFASRIDLADRWPFGALAPFTPIFELCRARGWRVVGVDPDPTGQPLADRDRFAAEHLAELLSGRPETRAMVLAGEMHLAPSHLPKEVKRALKRHGVDGEVLRVHQNPERIWFEQAEAGVPDEHDVLALEDGAFALLTASPVVCQQSFLTWLDQVRDGDLEGPHAVAAETGEKVFRQATRVLGKALGLPVTRPLEDVEVVGPADLSFFERLRRSGTFSKTELSQIRAHILASESYYVPRARLVYLATLSLNHAAEEAAHFLRHHFSGEGIDDPRGMVDAFYSRILNEAIGFMGSKIVNPKRKCPHPDDLRSLAESDEAPPTSRRRRSKERRPAPRTASTAGHEPGMARGVEPEVARFVLAHKRMERGERVPWLSKVFQGSAELFNAVTHVLGYLLGDQLYYGLVRGKLTKKEAKELFYEPFEDEGAALMLYFELAARVGALQVPRRP